MDDIIIVLHTKKELEVYMSPVRQQLLRVLALAGSPQTPKALSLRLGISPSSVQHHIKLLLDLGVVKVDHTEIINGITATYYAPTGATVRLGMDQSDGLNEREALALQLVQNVLQGFGEALRRRREATDSLEELARYGDLLTGVIHLTSDECAGLLKGMRDFMEAHKHPGPDTVPWELAFVAYDGSEP